MDAPLVQRLQTFSDDVRALSPPFAQIVDRMVARLQSSHVGQSAPAPGEDMPPFLLPDQNGNLVSLARLLENGPVVLSFHRGHWCPYCRLTADALARIGPELADLGAQIVAITPELQQYGGALKSYAKAPFPVLSDVGGGYALALSLLYWVGEEKRNLMIAAGHDIAQFQGNETWMLPIPATFVIGTDGLVKARYIDPDYRRRMDIDAILAAVRNMAAPPPG